MECVVVEVEDDVSLTGTYEMPLDTRLSEVMQQWKNDFELIGNWIFISSDEDDVCYDDWITLSMIKESSPRKVTLIAKPVSRLVIEIFLYLKDKCHSLFVQPHEKLCEVLTQLPESPKRLEYNGAPLNINDTVQQAGLQNNSIIYEPLFPVAVKLSSGVTVVVQLPSDNLVLHLKEKINIYEAGDFSLKCQGRYLRSDESISQLKHVIEVTTAEFVVHVNGRRISWRTKEAPMPVSEFVIQLANKGNIDTQKLEAMEFICIGCQRRISQSEDDAQKMSVECCKEKSRILNSMTPSDTESKPERNEMIHDIQSFLEHLVQCRKKNLGAETFRCMCRDVKEKLAKVSLDYNTLNQCSGSLLKMINNLEDKIKELEKEIEGLQTRNVANVEEIEKLMLKNTKLTQENNEMSEKIGVKLLVIYDPEDFSNVSCPEVEDEGQMPWSSSMSYIKCRVPGMRTGLMSFDEVRDILRRLLPGRGILTGWEIRQIGQCRGSVQEREVAEVTSNNDEVVRWDQSPYCDESGAQYSWREAVPEWQEIHAGGCVFICGGGRRTLLRIYS